MQRVRKALEPPGNARDDLWIIAEIAKRLGHDWGHPTAEDVWNEVRALAPIFAGMSYARLEQEGGLHWPCYDENHPGELFLHSRLWKDPVGGPPAPFSVVEHELPVERPDAEYPLPLTTGRRLTRTTPACRPAATLRRSGAASRSTSHRRTPDGWAL